MTLITTQSGSQTVTARANSNRFGLWRRALLGLVLLFTGISTTAWLTYAGIEPPVVQGSQGDVAPDPFQPGFTHNTRPSLLRHVKSWGYQLQKLNIDKAAASPFDLLVIDPAALDYGPHDWARRTLKRLQTMPPQPAELQTGNSNAAPHKRRIILSYLSIGEAESYRGYWRKNWLSAPATISKDKVTRPQDLTSGKKERAAAQTPSPAERTGSRLRLIAAKRFGAAASPVDHPMGRPSATAPPWLGTENSEWRGNYHVRFWHEGWKKKIFGAPDAMLDKIITAGFDGVYLDRADIYEHWQKKRKTAAPDMISFIVELARYARAQKPGFIIVLQNAEELLHAEPLRRAIDAVAKEDLLLGLSEAGTLNSAVDVDNSSGYLKLAQNDGRPIFVIEYIDDNNVRRIIKSKLRSLGFIPYFGPRVLDELRVKF